MTFNPMEMMFQSILNKNPQLSQYVSMAKQMTGGKSPEQVQQIAQNLAAQRGLNLNQVQQMMQQTMNQIMGGNSNLKR